jgi:hypothetical protein
MPEEKPSDPIEKFLLEEKAVEDRKQALIEDLLRQRADAIKAFDDKLAKLGYRGNSAGKPKKSHHKQPQPSADASAKPATKSKP